MAVKRWLLLCCSTGVGNYSPPEYVMRPVGTYMFARFFKFYSEYLIRIYGYYITFYRSRIDYIRLIDFN